METSYIQNNKPNRTSLPRRARQTQRGIIMHIKYSSAAHNFDNKNTLRHLKQKYASLKIVLHNLGSNN